MQRLAILPLAASIVSCLATAQDETKPWNAMDYGPVLSGTIDGYGADNTTYKARALDLGGGAWIVFDTELLRVASAWTDGYLELRGTAFDGGHGPVPHPVGTVAYRTERRPGWANGASRFDDPREGQRYGPLPRDYARYRGFYIHANAYDPDLRVVLAYEVAATAGSADEPPMQVLETFDRVEHDTKIGIARTIDVEGVHAAGALVAVADGDGRLEQLTDGSIQDLVFVPEIGDLVTLDKVANWNDMAIGAPSKADYADLASGNGVKARWIDEQGGALHPRAARPEGLLDGAVPDDADVPGLAVFSDDPKLRFALDLQRAVSIERVNTFAWHNSTRSRQKYTLYGSAADDCPDDGAADPVAAGWSEIAAVDTLPLGLGDPHGAAVGRADGAPLGTFRHLLFTAERASGGTFFNEVDVWLEGEAPPIRQRQRVARFGLSSAPAGAQLTIDGDRVVLALPPKPTRLRAEVVAWGGIGGIDDAAFAGLLRAAGTAADPHQWTRGGARRFPEVLTTAGRVSTSDAAFVVDTVTVPDSNPWNSRLRFGAFDFVGEDAAVLTTWNGDVWRVDGLDEDLDRLEWRRIATGLHDPLGVKVVDGVIHTHGRDGITRLHDLNGDGEIDWYECFNNDVLVTRAFHEFAFDLQQDAAGNFYFSKGGPVKPGGRGFDEITEHHGTILKLSKDGNDLEVYATGLRAPNGIGISPDGVVTTGDNEGSWMPKCRLNWLPEPGMFTSCVPTAHRSVEPAQYGDPLCWFPMSVDNSGGGQVWVPEGAFGPLGGRLLHQSYGTCRLFLVLPQHDGGRTQGGVAQFPLSFASSQMRGRFDDRGDLYVCGFKGWQTRAAKDTAFQRVRYVPDQEIRMPVGMTVRAGEIELAFSDALDPELAEDPESYAVEVWNYKWSSAYGSAEYRASAPIEEQEQDSGEANRDSLTVTGARLLDDGKTVVLLVDGLQRVMQSRIAYDLETASGALLTGDVYGTINFIPAVPSAGDGN